MPDLDRRTRLILTGLGGQHLHGFLPASDHKTAISHAVSSFHGWSADGSWGQVTKDGIGLYGNVSDAQHGVKPIEFVPWREVLDVVKAGARGARLADYLDAYQQFGGWGATQGFDPSAKRKTPEQIETGLQEHHRVHRLIRETTEAVIVAGCEVLAQPLTLF